MTRLEKNTHPATITATTLTAVALSSSYREDYDYLYKIFQTIPLQYMREKDHENMPGVTHVYVP